MATANAAKLLGRTQRARNSASRRSGGNFRFENRRPRMAGRRLAKGNDPRPSNHHSGLRHSRRHDLRAVAGGTTVRIPQSTLRSQNKKVCHFEPARESRNSILVNFAFIARYSLTPVFASSSTEDRSQHAAHNLSAHLAADRARGALTQSASNFPASDCHAPPLCAGAVQLAPAARGLSASRRPIRDPRAFRNGRKASIASRSVRAPRRITAATGSAAERSARARPRSVGPLSLRNETSASPTPSSVITRFDVEVLVLPKRLRGGLHRLLIARRERAQRMLHAIAELAEHDVGNVERILRARSKRRRLSNGSTEPPARFFPATPSARR